MMTAVLCCFGAFSTGDLAWAASNAHTVSLTVPEICRYRIESVNLVEATADERIYETRLAVFSNSWHAWNLQVQSLSGTSGLEWSPDGRNWQSLAEGMNDLLRGTKVNWTSYRVFYRLPVHRAATADPGGSLQLQYQLCYQN